LLPKSELASLGLFHSVWDKGDYDSAWGEMKRFFLAGGRSQDYDDILEEADSLPEENNGDEPLGE